MRIDGGRQLAHMPCKPLRQEEVPAGPADVGDYGLPAGDQAFGRDRRVVSYRLL